MDSNADTPVIAQTEGDIEFVSPSKRRKLFSFMDKSHITNKTRTAYHCSHDYLAAVHSEEEIKKGSLVYWKNNSITYPILSCLLKSSFSSCHISTCRGNLAWQEIFYDSNDVGYCQKTLKRYYS